MFKELTITTLMAILLAGCAKERPYEENTTKLLNAANGSEVSKESIPCPIGSGRTCVYVPSVTKTPAEVSASRPFWQGEEKLVVTQMTEDKLKVLQIEEDDRFNSNINNYSPVAEFEIEHVDYTCKEDSLGKCANEEVEDEEKQWHEKRFVRVGKMKVLESNSLPIQFGQLSNSGCYQELGRDYEEQNGLRIDGSSINAKVKVNYEANASCVMLREMDDLRYLNFDVSYHYSLAEIESLADASYEPVIYPKGDESRFGFFKTVRKSKTVDNHDHYMGLRTSLLNRWSPNKKEIVYNLNEDFFLPEMATILAATKKAISSVNDSLVKAKAPIQIKLVDGRGKDIGDLRNNFIVLESDPQASGVIGYGPSVSNPATGEILNARTVMYLGTIKKFIARTYDELYEEAVNGGASPQQQEQQAPKTKEAGKQSMANKLSMASIAPSKNFVERAKSASYEEFSKLAYSWETQIYDIFSDNIDYGAQLEKNALPESLKRFQERLATLSQETFYHGDSVDYEGAVKAFIHKTNKKWDELSEAQRAQVIDDLLPSVWTPTLVHEFGHNLGLRHNFYGSTDAENYYDEEEREELGIKRKVTYSSIMDYSGSTLNELPVMGKYDIAALKFAYARMVETVEGQDVQIKGTLSESKTQIKDFKYCSDEHVSTDSLCNRFDEGASHSEVVQYFIKKYQEDYSKRNFRGRRRDFSSRVGDWSYAISTLNTLSNIRQFFDRYDQKVYTGDYSKKPETKKEEEKLADIKLASDLAFDALMDILETPSYHCVELFVKDGKMLGLGDAKPFNEMAKGTKLEEYGITFDIANGCQYLSYFESQDPTPGLPDGVKLMYLSFGKYFNNSLDLSVPYDQKLEGDTSQVDVRGFWMDKVVAGLFVSMRSQSPTTIGAASNGNFLDYPEYEKRFMTFVDGLLKNKLKKSVEVKMGENVIGEVEVEYNFDGNHMVNKSYNPLVNYVFGLDSARSELKMTLMNRLKKSFKEPKSPTDYSMEVFHHFNVDKLPLHLPLDQFNYDQIVEFKNEQGRVTSRFGLMTYNGFGMDLLAKKGILEKVEALSQDELEELVNAATAKEKDGKLELSEKVAELISKHKETVVDILKGTINKDVLASSFVALSQKGDSVL